MATALQLLPPHLDADVSSRPSRPRPSERIVPVEASMTRARFYAPSDQPAALSPSAPARLKLVSGALAGVILFAVGALLNNPVKATGILTTDEGQWTPPADESSAQDGALFVHKTLMEVRTTESGVPVLRFVECRHYAKEHHKLIQTGVTPAGVPILRIVSGDYCIVAAKTNLWPVKGGLAGSFGERADPFTGEGEFHTGVDIRAEAGAPIRATADGVVTFSGRDGGYGQLVIVDHGGGVQTYYAHLSRIDTQEGRDVRRGEVLGAVGSTGRVTGPHLHYEVRIGGAPVNPYRYLSQAEVAPQTLSKDLPFLQAPRHQ